MDGPGETNWPLAAVTQEDLRWAALERLAQTLPGAIALAEQMATERNQAWLDLGRAQEDSAEQRREIARLSALVDQHEAAGGPPMSVPAMALSVLLMGGGWPFAAHLFWLANGATGWKSVVLALVLAASGVCWTWVVWTYVKACRRG